jgi:DNA repair protein RecN (Recombination protein N)
MLAELSIRDIVLIEKLNLRFDAGLSVLTGETGAGKSILLDALSLALGARGEGGLVRHGERQGQVSAVFDVPPGHSVLALLDDNGIQHEGSLILRRVQAADGRSKAFVNDQPVSVGLMRQIGHLLVELHGQHDERALIQPSSHRDMIDAFGALGTAAAGVAAAWEKLQDLRREMADLRERVDAAAREADYLRDSVAELEKLAPEPGEEEELAARRQTMMQAEKIASELNEAVDTLGGTASPLPVLSSLVRSLERKMAQAPGMLDEAVRQLDAGLDALHLAHQELERALRDADFDPRELEMAEERLFALRAASRKYSVAVENLPELAVKLADDLENLNAGEERLAAIEAQVREQETKFRAAASELSKLREQAAAELVTAVSRELPSLKLEAAEFIVHHEVDEKSAGAHGFDQMEFWVRTNPGTRAGSMFKVASGGELSRFMLALKVALAGNGSAPCLIFDEIDTGAGGAVADAIGRRLSRLAGNVQVICVTHAPQVAARAETHFRISKSSVDDGDGRTATAVRAISGEERREEVARMLAGASITDEARAAADQLIKQTAA